MQHYAFLHQGLEHLGVWGPQGSWNQSSVGSEGWLYVDINEYIYRWSVHDTHQKVPHTYQIWRIYTLLCVFIHYINGTHILSMNTNCPKIEIAHPQSLLFPEIPSKKIAFFLQRHRVHSQQLRPPANQPAGKGRRQCPPCWANQSSWSLASPGMCDEDLELCKCSLSLTRVDLQAPPSLSEALLCHL